MHTTKEDSMSLRRLDSMSLHRLHLNLRPKTLEREREIGLGLGIDRESREGYKRVKVILGLILAMVWPIRKNSLVGVVLVMVWPIIKTSPSAVVHTQ